MCLYMYKGKRVLKFFCLEVMTELNTPLLKTVYIYTLDCL